MREKNGRGGSVGGGENAPHRCVGGPPTEKNGPGENENSQKACFLSPYHPEQVQILDNAVTVASSRGSCGKKIK